MHCILYQFAVIGAGPAGIEAVSELAAADLFPILWIDPEFDCGEMKHYRNISSNNDIAICQNIVKQNNWIKNNHLVDEFMSLMDGYDKNDCPDLDLSYQTLIKMQSKLKESFGDKILMVKSNVNKFIEGDSWKVITDDGVEFTASNIFQCVGSLCKDIKTTQPQIFEKYPQLKFVPLNEVICPVKVRSLSLKDEVVVIFGRSHSGILALKELMNLPPDNRPSKFFLFFKGEVRWYEKQPDGKYYYNYSGLRGLAADWAKKNLYPVVADDLKMIESTEQNMNKILPMCTVGVSAVGFKRRSLAKIILKDGTELDDESIDYDGSDCYLFHHNRLKINGMYGLGIAFPEKWIDPAGVIDDKVGLFGFQDSAQKIIKSYLANKIKESC